MCAAHLVAAAGPPSVILVSIDTLRADHLSSYGYRKISTPRIDSYALDGGTLFSAIQAQVPITLPSHTVLFTSTYPFQNRVEENAERVPASAVTLASVLHDHGYVTGAFIGSVFLEKQLGLDRGFDVYDSPFRFEAFSPLSGEIMFGGVSRNPFAGRERRDGLLVIHAANDWLRSNGSRPLFAFVHLFDVHEPYRISAAVGPAGYDAEIRHVDRLLGDFRRGLERTDLWQRSIVIVLSDHGEGLNEHGEESHGYFIYQSTLWTPLLIHWPSGTGNYQARVTEPGGLIDVAPTILDFLQIPAPPSFRGHSLLSEAKGAKSTHTVYSETTYTHDAFGWAVLRSVRVGNDKYIEAPRPELYDLASDPAERTNLAARKPERARELRLELGKIAARYRANGEERKQLAGSEQTLRSLGYLASGPAAFRETGGADPKDRLAEYNDYRRAMLLIYDGRHASAVPILERLLARDPGNLLARRDLGASYFELREYGKAQQNLEAVAAKAPDDYMTRYELGLADEHLGRHAEAERNIAAACKIAPEAAQCEVDLKRIESERR